MPVERFIRHETPYIPFSENPNQIDISGFDVLSYIPPEKMDEYIGSLSEKIKLKDYDFVLVNMNGGKYLFDKLAELQSFQKESVQIEYHRPEGGFGAKIDIPVPHEAKGKKCLVVDDIYDTGGVLLAIMSELSADSQAVVIVTKRDIDNQLPIKNLSIGVKIDNVWIGGCGMDLGKDGEGDVFRNYPGIVVNNAS